MCVFVQCGKKMQVHTINIYMYMASQYIYFALPENTDINCCFKCCVSALD